MSKPFNIPTITELAVAQYNDMLLYQKKLNELDVNDKSSYGLFKREELERKVRESEFFLSRYKREIREEKLKRLGL